MKKIAIMLCSLLIVSACGIKPDQVDPPDAERGKNFPKTYPAPEDNHAAQR